VKHLPDKVPHDSYLVAIKLLLEFLIPDNSVDSRKGEKQDDNGLNFHGALIVVQLCNREFEELLIENTLFRREEQEVGQAMRELVILARHTLTGCDEAFSDLTIQVFIQSQVLLLQKLREMLKHLYEIYRIHFA
jgi:hypothetical protein